MASERSRRVKVAYAPESMFLTMFEARLCPRSVVSVPVTDKIPEGCKIERVYYDASRQGFGVLLSHPDWDIVPDGTVPPEVGRITEFKYAESHTYFTYQDLVYLLIDKADNDANADRARHNLHLAQHAIERMLPPTRNDSNDS